MVETFSIKRVQRGGLAYVLMFSALVVAGCAEAGARYPADDVDSAITERYWKLVELHGKPVNVVGSREPHIILKAEDRRVAGSGGCNNLMGGYELSAPNRIRFSKMASTMMACPQGMDIEQGLFGVLESADSYTVNGDTMVLNRARMAPLARFEAVYLR